MPSYHAKLSPSSASRWTTCSASIDAQEGIPNTNSDASREGTCCHQILAECLEDQDIDLQGYLGRVMEFWRHDESDSSGEDWSSELDDSHWEVCVLTGSVTVTQPMLDAVHSVIEYVLGQYLIFGGRLEVEQRVPIGFFTGEEGAGGTSDICIIPEGRSTTVRVLDAKFGRHKVEAFEILRHASEDLITGEYVPAITRPNLQMACYALGSIEKFNLWGVVTHVTMTIVQPFVHHISEYTCTIEELCETMEFMRGKANETRDNPVFQPSKDNCHFCRRRGDCKAETAFVVESALEGFEDMATAVPREVPEHNVGVYYEKVPMIEQWCKAIERQVRTKLNRGEPVVRSDGVEYKLVLGRKGDREWASVADAELELSLLPLSDDERYKPRKLASPADIEKLTKTRRPPKGEKKKPARVSYETWTALQALIRQDDGAPTIALGTDPRPAMEGVMDGFGDVEDDQNGDLF